MNEEEKFYSITFDFQRGGRLCRETYSLPIVDIGPVKICLFDTLSNAPMCVAAASMILYKLFEDKTEGYFDTIVVPETKGIALGHHLARLTQRNVVVLRKSEKLYNKSAFCHKFKSITTAGEQVLHLPSRDMYKIEGQRVLLLDDVYSTGCSMKAMDKLITDAGGIVVDKFVVLVEGTKYLEDDFGRSIRFCGTIPIL